MLKIICTSDLHGALPEIEPCDLFLISGDVCPIRHENQKVHDHDPHAQRDWILGEYTDWLESVPAKQIVWIAGNHDFGAELAGMRRTLRRESPKHIHYLADEAIELFGQVIYGSPWSPNLSDWAFYGTDKTFKYVSQGISYDTDILMLHSPPRGCFLDGGHPEWASPFVMEDIIRRIKPKLVLCGHLHEGYGDHEILGTRFINAAYYKDDYETIQPPVVVELDE